MEVGNLKFSWKIKNFSSHKAQNLYSDVFSIGPYKWIMVAYPKADNNYLSIFLRAWDWETLPSGWSRKAKFSFTLVDQIDKESSITKTLEKEEFNGDRKGVGFHSFISYKDLYEPSKGYIVDDTCIIKADVTAFGDAFVEEPAKNRVEEDIDAFFVDLNSVIFPKKIVSAEEEAKEALTMIEEALNMAPTEFNNPSRISQLKYAFDVLSSLDDCSMLMTSEQKIELLSMKDNFIVLPERAAKAVENIKLFDEKEVMKMTLDRKLGRCLTEFEKVKSESIFNELFIATLLAQIEKMKEIKQNTSSKHKELFKLSKELKYELDVLLKDWSECEAKRKAAEEEKVVGREWGKMKQLVSSLKKPFESVTSPL